MINNKFYRDGDILPFHNKFPFNRNAKGFFIVEPNVCKQIKYVEVYKIFDFEKIYLYDYLNKP